MYSLKCLGNMYRCRGHNISNQDAKLALLYYTENALRCENTYHQVENVLVIHLIPSVKIYKFLGQPVECTFNL